MDMLASIFTMDNLFTLVMLTFLQIVLGFDNLLYISIESKRVQQDKQSMVRRYGLFMAIFLRIALLWIILTAIPYLQSTIFSMDLWGVMEGHFSWHSLIVLFGGMFIIYTAMKEIYHMLGVDDLGHEDGQNRKSVAQALTMIVVMNLIFSFDSILSAIALTDVFWVMAVAIMISGALMILLVDHVAGFLQKNRMYEILGLFILFIVGIMLVTEGGHLAHVKVIGQPVEKMAMSTFYFVIGMLVIIDLIQSRYQKKLLAQKESRAQKNKVA